MICKCADWKPNMELVNEPLLFCAARNPGQWNYEGKVFKYCPWCGSELQEEDKPGMTKIMRSEVQRRLP